MPVPGKQTSPNLTKPGPRHLAVSHLESSPRCDISGSENADHYERARRGNARRHSRAPAALEQCRRDPGPAVRDPKYLSPASSKLGESPISWSRRSQLVRLALEEGSPAVASIAQR
jgi:hypothetical protein